MSETHTPANITLEEWDLLFYHYAHSKFAYILKALRDTNNAPVAMEFLQHTKPEECSRRVWQDVGSMNTNIKKKIPTLRLFTVENQGLTRPIDRRKVALVRKEK